MKRYRIHRLVAQAFIENPYNLETVNHKNHKRNDNKVSNLEWLSFADNIREAKSVKVCLLDENDNIIEIFSSIKDASRKTGVCRNSISKTINNKQKTAKNLKFRKYHTGDEAE